MAYFPIPLEDTPSTFASGMLGKRVYDNKNNKTYVFCKNTDASSIGSGDIVTLETTSTYYVDLCASTELPFGVVTNAITGGVAAVNDGVWIQVQGRCEIPKGLATGSSAITAGDNLYARSGGDCQSTSGTVGARSLEALNIQNRIGEAFSTVASSATTNVDVLLKG